MFTFTAYGSDCTGCSGRTASGTVPEKGRTIAVDPDVIPLGSEVMIDGHIYVAEDTGGAIKGNKIDMVVGTGTESISDGGQEHEVVVRKEPNYVQ